MSTVTLDIATPIVMVADVGAILPDVDLTDAKTVTQLTSFITDAHVILFDYLGVDGGGLELARLMIIEKYFAAHMYTSAIDHGGITYDKQGEAIQQYNTDATKGQTGLAATRYGQLVMSLDSTGLLSAFGSTKKPALFRVVSPGTPPFTPYGPC